MKHLLRLSLATLLGASLFILPGTAKHINQQRPIRYVEEISSNVTSEVISEEENTVNSESTEEEETPIENVDGNEEENIPEDFNFADYISQDEEGNITFKLPDGVTYEQFLSYLEKTFGNTTVAEKTTSAIQWLYDLLNTTWFTVGGVSISGSVLIYAIYKWKTGKNGQIVELEKQNKELKVNLDDLNEFQEKTKAQVELYAKVITAILQASQNKKLKALADEMLGNNTNSQSSEETPSEQTENEEEQVKVVIKDE